MARHFVITTIGTSGDIFPFIELGKYLAESGYKLSFLTNPYYKDAVESHGFKFVPFGTTTQFSDALQDPELWDAKHGFNILWAKVIQPNMHCIRLYVQSLGPHEEVAILCHPALMPLANLARADRNLKIVLFYFYPTIIRSDFGRFALGGLMTMPQHPKFFRRMLFSFLDKFFLDVGIVPVLNQERVALSLPPINHLFPHLQNSADLYVTLFPEWYSSIKPDYPKPLVSGDFIFAASTDDHLTDELMDFLQAGDPPFLFTPGTGNLHARKFFDIALDAVKKLNVRAIFATRFKEQLPPNLPDSVLWQAYVPFHRVLSKISIIVHHGGIGTLAEASKAGVPQLIIPFAYDQFDNGLIVEELGVGKSVPMQFLTRKKILRGLSEIQDSWIIRDNCKKIAANFKSCLAPKQIMEKVLSAI
jgi:rhamnosyltransferase subunit B